MVLAALRRAAASMRIASIRPSAALEDLIAEGFDRVPSSRCTAASARTARCRARSNCWAFRTPAAV
jgi:hypothetical protein